MRDRIPVDPGRVKMTRSDGTFEYVTLERADNPTQEGTPLNKALLDYAVAACGVTAGTATALTLDDAFGGFTLVDGAKVNFRLHVASGANPTLNVNGTGAKALVDVFANPMPSGIAANMWIEARYSALLDVYVVGGGDRERILIDEVEGSALSAISLPIPAACRSVRVEIEGVDLEYVNTSVKATLTAATRCSRNQSNVTLTSNEITNSAEYFSDTQVFSGAMIDGRTKIVIDIKFSGTTGYFESIVTALHNDYGGVSTHICRCQGIATMTEIGGNINISFSRRILSGVHVYMTGVIS